MKTITYANKISNRLKQIGLFTASAVLFFACSNDDNGDNPEPVDEEETITTMTVTLAQSGGETIILESKDLDGDGPKPPEISVSGNLTADSAYTGSIKLLNETESPAEDITEEIEEKDEEHQFFFNATGSLTGTSYEDTDENGNPVGLSFTLNSGAAGNGTLAITLRHQPKKPNDGTLADAGGETDIAQTFEVIVE